MITENLIRFVFLDIGLGVGLALGVILNSWLLRAEQKARRFVYVDEAGTVQQVTPQQHTTPATASNEARMLRNEKLARLTTRTKKEST